MVFPKARLAVSAGLFLAWIGFLFYLVVRTRDPVILSRPQFLVSNLVVLAEVKEDKGRPAPNIKIKEVLRSADPSDQSLAGTEIQVEDLADCLKPQGWDGAQTYIVPLVKRKEDQAAVYQVTPLPVVPGYRPHFVTVELASVGPNKDQVAELIKQYFDVPADTLEKWEKKKTFAPLILRRNVPKAQAQEIQQALTAAGALVSDLERREAETRIYRANADALAQWQEIAAARGH
jgi:hypothetical protein